MSTVQVSPCCTCAKNANTHPGEVVIHAKQKRRTKAQKAVDHACDQKALIEKEAAAVQGLEQLIDIQVKMAADEAQAATTAPKGVRPHPWPIKKAPADSDEGQPAALADDSDDPAAAYAEHSKDTADGDGDLEVDSDMDTTETTHAGDQKGKLAECASFLYTTMLMLMESTLFFLNLTSAFSSSQKSSLSGRVNNWNSKTVSDSQSRKPSASTMHSSLCGTSVRPPPSSIFSVFSRSTAVTSLPDPGPVPCTGSSNDLLVGGYADEDLLNDLQEYAVAMQSRGKGKQIMKTNLHIVTPHSMDRTSDQVLAFGTRALKRKGFPNDVLSVLETDSEQSESSIESIDSDAMDVALQVTTFERQIG
ncbi:hypothetical protein BU15DRAFT_82339 [Melanogaster broomeanus]|nr:hypothetical protein BU15DRAFT_82339 [Melanogaster broomeanus]